MNLQRQMTLVGALFMGLSCACAQSDAALGHLVQRYGEDGVDAMRHEAHYRFESMLLYYAGSFLVMDQGTPRPALESEIAQVDIARYEEERKADERVRLRDEVLGKELVLFGRSEFEALVLERLSVADRAAYSAYRSAAEGGEGQQKQHP